MVRRLPVIGVMGSGSVPHAELAAPLGRLIANLGAHLLTGGGSGVMSAVAEAFVAADDRAGLSLGILPGDWDCGQAPDGYPNPWVELVVRTHLPGQGEDGEGRGSRNAINVLSADRLVILPGGYGTRSEAHLAVRYRKPAISFGASYAEIPEAKSLAEVEAFLRDF